MKITIIGAGRVASCLAPQLNKQGHDILQVFNRTLKHAQQLSKSSGSEAINRFSELTEEADIYLISVSDDAIKDVANKVAKYVPTHKCVAHTAGNVSTDVFSTHFMNYGVLYPLQSFVHGRPILLSEVPFCITASNVETVESLRDLASCLTQNIHVMSDADRQKIHVPAVFVNNFTNYLLTLAKGYCQKEGLSFEILKPLLKETMARIMDGEDPEKMQTGPAMRGDNLTIQRHQNVLKAYPEHNQIYRFLTQMINKKYVG